MAKYSDADTLVDIVLTIKFKKAKEFLLLTCHDLIKESGNNKADFLLSNIVYDMGYDKRSFEVLINQYK